MFVCLLMIVAQDMLWDVLIFAKVPLLKMTLSMQLPKASTSFLSYTVSQQNGYIVMGH